jgi:hypothetical protein
MGEEVMLGSSPPGAGGPEALDGPDIGRGVGPDPDARLLFRGPVGDEVSGLPDVSAVVEGRGACEGDIAAEVSTSVWFPRLDIGDESGCDAQPSDIEVREIRKAGERCSSLLCAIQRPTLLACGLVDDDRPRMRLARLGFGSI